MTRSILLLCLLSFGPTQCSCATDETVSSTELDLSKEDLTASGYKCTQKDPQGYRWYCEKCTTITDVAGSHTVCWGITCYGSPDGSSECGTEETAAPTSGYWLEAEAATLYGSMQKLGDANASSGTALYVGGSGSTRTYFSTLADETFTAWARVIAPSTSANSIYMQVDAGSAQLIELPVATTWTWVPLPATYTLAAGTHALRFYAGEIGVKIDRVVFHGDPAFVPVVQTIQGESAAIVAPMQIGTQRTIPTTSYIWVPNGAGTNGLAQLQVSVPYADRYYVWGRFNAPTEADNSFYIGKLGEPRVAWGMATTSASDWHWDRADISGVPSVFWLDDFEVLELAQREDGTKLDKLVITNDPDFKLVDPAPLVVSQ